MWMVSCYILLLYILMGCKMINMTEYSAAETIQAWLAFKGRGFTQKRLSIESGLAQNTISFIVNGRTKPDTDSLEKISRALGITLEQFWAGPPGVREIPLPMPVYDMKGVRVGELSRERIPLLTNIPAGPWMSWIDTYQPGEGEEYIERGSVAGQHVVAIRVRGDSMEPELHNGDVLVLNPEIAFYAPQKKGRIGVVKYNDDFKIRRVHITPDGNSYLLEPANRAYECEMIPVTGTVIFKIVDIRLKLDERF